MNDGPLVARALQLAERIELKGLENCSSCFETGDTERTRRASGIVRSIMLSPCGCLALCVRCRLCSWVPSLGLGSTISRKKVTLRRRRIGHSIAILRTKGLAAVATTLEMR